MHRTSQFFLTAILITVSLMFTCKQNKNPILAGGISPFPAQWKRLSIPGSESTYALAQSPSGDLLVATIDALYHYSPATGTGKRVASLETGARVSVLTADDRDLFYIGLNNGKIFRYSLETDTAPELLYSDTGNVPDIAIHPQGIIFLAFSEFLVRSTSPAGDAWERVGDTLATIHDLLIRDNGDIFVAAGAQGVFYSTDLGTTWQALNNNLSAQVSALTFTASGDLIAVTDEGIYRYRFGTGEWSRIATPEHRIWRPITLPDGRIMATRSIPSCACPPPGILYSPDDGHTWLIWSLENALVYDILPGTNGAIFAATDAGVFRTTDDGEHWEYVDVGIVRIPIWTMRIFPDGSVYVGTFQGNLLFSGDWGDSWAWVKNLSIETHREFAAIQDILVTPGGYFLSSIYSEHEPGTENFTLHSLDGGETWEILPSLPAARNLTFLPSGKMMAIFDRELRISGDEVGLTWVPVNTPGDAWRFTATPGGEVWLVVKAFRHYTLPMPVYYSLDEGITWQEAGEIPTDVEEIHSSPTGTIFVRTLTGELYRYSRSQGEWIKVTLPSNLSEVGSLTINSQNILFIAPFGTDQVFASTDEGNSWLPIVPAPGSGRLFGNTEVSTVFLAPDDTEQLIRITPSAPVP